MERVLFIEDNTTGINAVRYNETEKVDVFTLNGTRILQNVELKKVHTLPKGVYIVKGKKYIVK